METSDKNTIGYVKRAYVEFNDIYSVQEILKHKKENLVKQINYIEELFPNNHNIKPTTMIIVSNLRPTVNGEF